MPASEIAVDAFDLVEACDSEDAEPDSAHVPGARRLDMHLLEGPPDWNAKPVGMLRRSLERLDLRKPALLLHLSTSGLIMVAHNRISFGSDTTGAGHAES